MNRETNEQAQPMLDGQSGRREVIIDGDIAYVHHVTYNKATQSKFQCQWNLDFTNIPKKKLLEWAAKHIVIQLRPEFKNNIKSPTIHDTHDTYSMEEYMDRERGRTSPIHKMKALAKTMSSEELEALIKEIQSEESES